MIDLPESYEDSEKEATDDEMREYMTYTIESIKEMLKDSNLIPNDKFTSSAPSIIRQLVDENEHLQAMAIDRELLSEKVKRLQAENEKLVGRVEELRKLDTLSREIDGEEIQRLKDDLASSEDCTKRVAHQYVHLKKDIERLQSQLAKYERVAEAAIKFCESGSIHHRNQLQEALKQSEPTKE